jgi:hypothetical protein
MLQLAKQGALRLFAQEKRNNFFVCEPIFDLKPGKFAHVHGASVGYLRLAQPKRKLPDIFKSAEAPEFKDKDGHRHAIVSIHVFCRRTRLLGYFSCPRYTSGLSAVMAAGARSLHPAPLFGSSMCIECHVHLAHGSTNASNSRTTFPCS